MKALEKDRTRRYETANGFAADVQRYLADEPVQACPPSAAYRFRKFARRNKAPLLTAAVLSRRADRGRPWSAPGRRSAPGAATTLAQTRLDAEPEPARPR